MTPQTHISDAHRQRLAYVYIRQSTLRQVSENQESQDLQYQLASRARQLGWPDSHIVIIDEDLGKSAVSRLERTGFQRLFTDVGTGKVGILLVTDVSRLARNCADWYQLLDIAAYNDVLVTDSGGIYNPRAYDDRLLLGVKGAFSEAQWHVMRQQMQAARLNKAKRGELAMRLPIGYERLPNGDVIQTPDKQVQQAIHLVFRLFDQCQSARGVLRQLVADDLQLPKQSRNVLGQAIIVWSAPSYSQVYHLLKLPAYAGAYTYGKRQREPLPGSNRSRYGGWLPADQWQVLRHDAFPAYISWQKYEQNQAVLAQNWGATRFADPASSKTNLGIHNAPFSPRGATPQRGAVGKGKALLTGLVICGHCGRRMRVRYRDKPAYVCEATKNQFNAPRCQYVPHAHVDQTVAAAFLEAAQPAALTAALAALDQLESDQQQVNQQWQQQLERAQYNVNLAQTRYQQVDPHLRLVANELERLWEDALQEKQRLQQAWQQFQNRQTPPITADDITLIQQLAQDLPQLWAAPSTTIPDRKRLLRTLIHTITLETASAQGETNLTIQWHTQAKTPLTAKRPRPGHPSDHTLLARVRDLTQAGYSDETMATILNQEGLVSSWHVKDDPTYVVGQPVSYWTTKRVAQLRNRHQVRLNPAADGFIPLPTAAQQLDVSPSVILEWYRRGFLQGRQYRPRSPVWIWLDETTYHRVSGQLTLKAAQTADSSLQLYSVSQAKQMLGLTTNQLTTALQSGDLLAWRLKTGRSYRWYLQILSPISTFTVETTRK